LLGFFIGKSNAEQATSTLTVAKRIRAQLVKLPSR
jgi:hypothetical protein